MRATSPRRVMIVEDEAIVAEDLRHCLDQLGYHVVGIADTVSGAEQLARQHRPDLALLDIRIKGEGDGIELASRLRQQHIGFVYLTSHSDENTLGRARFTEPLGYVLKPFHVRDLHPVLEMAFHRHAAELQLRQMETWLATTLRSIGDAVVVTDAQGLVTYLNPAAERLTGWPSKEAVGLPSSEVLVFVHDVSHEPLSDVVTSAIEHQTIVYLEPGAELVRRDGMRVPIDDCAAPVRGDDGRVTGAVVVVQDATLRMRAMREQNEAKARLEEARRLLGLGAIAGGLAHDLNNILTAILGEVGLAQEQAKGSLCEHLAEIEAHAMTAGSMCRALLSGAGAGPLEREPVDVVRTAEECVTRVKAVASREVSFEVVVDEAGLLALANPVHLHQVLQNLVQNAAEALTGRSGNVAVRVTRTRLPAQGVPLLPPEVLLPAGDYLCIEVADDGPGMVPEVLQRIFDPFFTTKLHGRGLGLASVRGIVRRNGGAITVVSEPDAGTVFRVLWPASPATGAAAEP